MSNKPEGEGRSFIESLMSNFDHEIDAKIAERLKAEHCYSQYSGWNFCGYVWWDEGAYFCEVWHYNEPQEIVSGTLKQIMNKVSDKWGWE